MIDSLKTVYSLDTTRFYCAGLSMGGAGTWGMVKSYPKKFAAAIPCAGAMGWNTAFTVSMIDGANTAKTPYWAFHGIADPTVDVMYSRRIDTAVRNAGFPVVHYTSYAYLANPTGISTDSLKKTVVGGALWLYSEIINGDHKAGWMEAWHHPFIVPWLFSKSKVNGQTVFTWPAPGVLETTIFSERPVSSIITEKLQAAAEIIRWNGVSHLPQSISIYTVKGTLVKRYQIFQSQGTIHCPNLAKGIYFVTMSCQNGSTGKIMTLSDDRR